MKRIKNEIFIDEETGEEIFIDDAKLLKTSECIRLMENGMKERSRLIEESSRNYSDDELDPDPLVDLFNEEAEEYVKKKKNVI